MFYQTLILTAPIHCRASIAETHFYKPDEETNLAGLSCEHNFINILGCVNYKFRGCLNH